MSVVSGIIASTWLAVLFVPSFAVLEGFEERRRARKNKKKPLATVPAK